MDILAKVQSRELGEFPVSYGTSMAILLLADSNSESPSLKEAKVKPEELWINVGTLFRNLENVIDATIIDKVTAEIAIQVLIEEIRLTVNYLRDLYGDKLRIVFYQSTYEYLSRKFPRAAIKHASTKKQLAYDNLLIKTLKGIQDPLKHLIAEDFTIGKKPYVDYRILKDFPDANYKTIWVITHHVVDLLGFRRAKEVKLLESHTARLRSKFEWNQKLTGKKLEKIPFNKLTIQIFGDKGTNFNSMGAKFKNLIFELANEYKWNPSTTETSVKYNLSTMKDTFTGKIFTMMLK